MWFCLDRVWCKDKNPIIYRARYGNTWGYLYIYACNEVVEWYKCCARGIPAYKEIPFTLGEITEIKKVMVEGELPVGIVKCANVVVLLYPPEVRTRQVFVRI